MRPSLQVFYFLSLFFCWRTFRVRKKNLIPSKHHSKQCSIIIFWKNIVVWSKSHKMAKLQLKTKWWLTHLHIFFGIWSIVYTLNVIPCRRCLGISVFDLCLHVLDFQFYLWSKFSEFFLHPYFEIFGRKIYLPGRNL